MAKCCICERKIEREDAPVLSMGGAGYARLLCDECDGLLTVATEGTDFNEIERAMDQLGKKISGGNPDGVTFDMMNNLMREASERAKAIRDGSYDFSLDRSVEDEEWSLEDIPEELRESEEDKAKDKADEEKMKKFDKFSNWVFIGALIGCVLFVVYKIIETYFLK